MSRSKHGLRHSHFFKFPTYKGWYGEEVWNAKTVKWFKRLANKARRRDGTSQTR